MWFGLLVAPRVDFIGTFKHLPKHTKLLLQRAGLREEYGATYDDGKDAPSKGEGGGMCAKPTQVRPTNYTAAGFNQKGASSSSKIEEYYTPELLKTVRDAYHWDVTIWKDLKGRFADDVVTGKDLAIVKNTASGDVLDKHGRKQRQRIVGCQAKHS